MSESNKWWEKHNPSYDWESLYKKYPDADFDKLYSKLPKTLRGNSGGTSLDKKSYNVYKNMVYKMLHGKQTSRQIDQILKSGDPMVTVPRAAEVVSTKANEAFKKNGKDLPMETVLGGALVIGTELMEIAKAGNYFPVDKENAMSYVEQASKAAIKSGLKEGYIDPVKFQEQMNQGMSQEASMRGMEAGQKAGIPQEADETIAMEQYALNKMKQGNKKGGALSGL